MIPKGTAARVFLRAIVAAGVAAFACTCPPGGDAMEPPRKGGGIEAVLTPPEPEQGDPVRLFVRAVPIPDNVVFIRKGVTYPMTRHTGPGEGFRGIFGVDLLEPPGAANLTLVLTKDGAKTRIDLDFTVRERGFPVQRMTLPKAMAVFDARTLGRIRAETAALAAIFSRPPTEPRWEIPFRPPLADFRPGNFGARRVINGEERAPHAGVDVNALAGTPVYAIAEGRVVFAGEQFFAGKSVVLDHGSGVYSLYYHLDGFSVEEGETVARGQGIGTVGSTGRATGPHLHFSVRAAGARVDPSRLPGLDGN